VVVVIQKLRKGARNGNKDIATLSLNVWVSALEILNAAGEHELAAGLVLIEAVGCV
jgi:hypothetical protein